MDGRDAGPAARACVHLGEVSVGFDSSSWAEPPYETGRITHDHRQFRTDQSASLRRLSSLSIGGTSANANANRQGAHWFNSVLSVTAAGASCLVVDPGSALVVVVGT